MFYITIVVFSMDYLMLNSASCTAWLDLWTFRPFVSSPPGRFAPWTFRHLDVSPPRNGRFAPLIGEHIHNRLEVTERISAYWIDLKLLNGVKVNKHQKISCISIAKDARSG